MWMFDLCGRKLWLIGILGWAMAGSAQETTNLPVILAGPNSQSLQSGELAAFSVTAGGAEPLRYQWSVNGTNLVGATNASYVIPGVDIRYCGDYAVEAANAYGAVTSAVARLRVDAQLTFRILALQTNGIMSADVTALIGQLKGGIAVSADSVLVTGSSGGAAEPRTARVPIDTLSGGATLTQGFDALVGNLRTETAYCLGNGANPIRYVNRALSSTNVTSLLELDGATGLLNGRRINMGRSIPLDPSWIPYIGLFSGYDRVVVHTGLRVYNIDLPSGRVLDLGRMTPLVHNNSQNFAYYGIAEYWSGSVQLVAVQNYYMIGRRRVGESVSRPVLRFDNYASMLGNYMASLTFSPSHSRWYALAYGPSLFGQVGYGTEILGSAKASFTQDPGYPEIVLGPTNQVSDASSNVTFVARGDGALPLAYQWYLNDQPLLNATNPTLALLDIGAADEGNYRVEVSNSSGLVSSENAYLNVFSRPEFTSLPVSRSVFVGSNAMFSVSINAAPPASFQWFSNGVPIGGATNSVLWLTNVQMDQAGQYSVQISNRFGMVMSPPAQLNPVIAIDDGSVFRITALLTNGFQVVDTYPTLRDFIYGPFAASSTRIFYSGGSRTAHNSLFDLSGGTVAPQMYAGLASNLRTEQVYALGNGGTPIGYNIEAPVTTLLEINGATGALTANQINLSRSIPFAPSGTEAGIFSGYGRIVLLYRSRVYNIAVPSGVVTDLGPMPTPQHASSYYNGAFWGVAEHFGGVIYLVYARDSRRIVRTRVPDGEETTAAEFLNLSSYMSSLTVSIAQKRWFFQHVGGSQFASSMNNVLGTAPASFEIDSGPAADHFEWGPIPALAVRGQPFEVRLEARTRSGLLASNYQGVPSLSGVSVPGGANVMVDPSAVSNFVEGVWTGQVRVLQPVSALKLRARDPDGTTGESAAFAVNAPNDLMLSVTDTPDPVVVGFPLSYQISVTNVGPADASGVRLTNLLPAAVELVDMSASPGIACYNESGTIWCDLGDVTATQSCSIRIEVVPSALGTLTNSTTVWRSDADADLANNTAITLTAVTLPRLSIDDVSIIEGDAGTNEVIFNVRLAQPSTNTVSVGFSTANDSAVSSGTFIDYVARSGVLVFPPGVTNQTINIGVRGDTLYEIDERFFVRLMNPTNAVVEHGQGICTILNDDPLPLVEINDPIVTEPDAGTSNALFQVRLSAACGYPVTVYYATSNGTAVAGSDYSGRSSQMTFPPGGLMLTQNLAIPIVGDTVTELDEYFYVNLTGATNALLSKAQGRCTILNNDPRGQLHHFVWEPIASPQQPNVNVAVKIQAQDVFGEVASNFTGRVAISATIGIPYWDNTNYMLVNRTTVNKTMADQYTIGYEVIPETNIYVTHLRAYSGTKVSLWTETGTLLASVPTTADPGSWTEIALASPVQLRAGNTYRVGFYAEDALYYFIYPRPYWFSHGRLGQSYIGIGDSFPNFDLNGDALYLVDLKYRVGMPTPSVAVAPTNSGDFTNGIWLGSLTVSEQATNVYLRAMDDQQHSGFSNPFDVLAGTAVDSDGDGMSDDWELAHNLDPHNASDALLDPDHDGHNNLQEFLAGTDPQDANSVMRITRVQLSGADVRLEFRGAAGKSYRLERRDALGTGDWTGVQDFTLGGASQTVVIDGGAATTNRFYRVRLLP